MSVFKRIHVRSVHWLILALDFFECASASASLKEEQQKPALCCSSFRLQIWWCTFILVKTTLTFCLSVNWHQSKVKGKRVIFSCSLPMIRQIKTETGWHLWNRPVCGSCTVSVYVCVCLTKGMHYCELHSHKALQEQPDKGGLFTIIMHLIFAHQTLLPGLITRSLI